MPRRNRTIAYLLMAIAVFAITLTGWGRDRALADTPRHYTELQFAPAPEVRLPDYTRFELENGLVVYLMEDHELPIVSGSAMIRTGDRLEPADKVGLAGIVGEVMRSGGTTEHSADELNQLLEQRAASVETGIDIAVGSASFGSLTEDLPEVFNLFAEVLRQPAFPQDKIDLAKTQRSGGIARRNDDPDEIAGREFQKLIYGAESPYARTIEYASLANINREDIVNFYRSYFHPNNMLLGIVGDFDPTQMRSLIEAAFGDWQPDPDLSQEQTLPTVNQAQAGKIFLVDQPQLTQSTIQIGHLGGRLDNPAHAALSVLNEVLNNFGGRLVNEVRSRQGLAYVVYAFWSPRFDYPGLFVGGGQTRSEATVPFIRSLGAEIEKARTTLVSQAELDRAKDSVLNAFIFNFQTPAQTLSRLMRYEYYGYPSDFIFRYQKQVEETTAEQVQIAAETYLKPEQLVTLVVGNNAAISPPLSELGRPIESIDITIPPAP
ncbi:insulinase family protein [Microcoleus sp. FACHB-1515]|uniref:insulinase family protein n=1 Tax=Cyanophyceae TaxID=3028117 RepID=UPI00168482AD|nr:insulinase family protein [Microcoleus sp. FACHB-1515]